MNSTVTTKYQTTIPKAVREQLGIAVHDSLEWIVDKGTVVVQPVHSNFLSYQGSIKTGSGDITADIQSARVLVPTSTFEMMMERLNDLDLEQLVNDRQNETSIKVSLDEL